MDRTIDRNLFMGIRPGPSRSITPEQTNIIVRIPTPSPPPTAQIKNQPRDGETCAAGTVLTQGLPNFVSKFRCNPLIGIHKQNPIFGCLRMRKCLLLPISSPGPLNDPVCISPADLNRSIRAIGINNDDFVAPSQTFEAGGDVFLFIETNHDSGNRRPWSPTTSWPAHSFQNIEVETAKIKLTPELVHNETPEEISRQRRGQPEVGQGETRGLAASFDAQGRYAEAHSGGDKTQRSIVQGTNLALLVLAVVEKTMIKLGPFWCSYFFSVSPETSLQVTQPAHNAPFGLMHFGAVPQDAIGTQP